ncbi:MAG: hypothetical protein ACJA0X_000461 [Cyclobacteriaceae bacterium]|jgi:hypothetical protein
MQVTHTTDYFKKHIWTGFKIIGTTVIFVLIALKILESPIALNEFAANGVGTTVPLVLLLSIVNWLLEAQKWRLAVPSEKLSLKDAVKIVLGGQAMNWIMPYATGDFLVRLARVKDRYSVAKSALMIRFMSLIITISLGTVSILYFFQILDELWSAVLFTVFCGIIISSFNFLKSLERFNSLINITILRYFVFTCQLYLLIDLYIDLSALQIFFGVGWIFFFKTFTPGILGKAGIREASGMVFFENMLPQTSIIIIPCFLIWLINSVLPSIIGVLILMRSRYSLYT